MISFQTFSQIKFDRVRMQKQAFQQTLPPAPSIFMFHRLRVKQICLYAIWNLLFLTLKP